MLSKARVFQQMQYFPHSHQLPVHANDARFRIVAAGSRGGKSMLTGAEIVYELLLPTRLVWCVATQYILAEKEFDWALNFLEKLKFNGRKLLDFAKISNSQKGSKIIEFAWGSRLETRSCEKPKMLLGAELDLLVLCEASQIPKSIWNRYLRFRIASRMGRVIATSTPNADGGLFYELFNNAKEGKEEGWAAWQFESRDNPTFPQKEWTRMENELDKKVFDEQARGLFVSRRGHVFSLSQANYTAQEILPDWPILVGIHYKPNNPVAVVFLTVPPGDQRKYIVFDEIYSEEKTALDIVPQIREKLIGRPRVLGVFCDYWDPAIQKELMHAGFALGLNRTEKEVGKAVAAQKRVQGLQNVLKVRQDGTSRLVFHTRCTNTIRDFSRVKWPDRKEEEEEKPEHENPLGKFMFAPNAVSYVLAFCEVSSGVDFYKVPA